MQLAASNWQHCSPALQSSGPSQKTGKQVGAPMSLGPQPVQVLH